MSFDIRTWLQENDRTLVWLSKTADVSWSTVCRAANGRPIDLKTAVKLAKVTGATLAQFGHEDVSLEGLEGSENFEREQVAS